MSAHYHYEAMAAVDEAARQAEASRFQVLKALGWIYTQQTPTFLWMWQKKLMDGRVVVVRLDDAWMMAKREVEVAMAMEQAESKSE